MAVKDFSTQVRLRANQPHAVSRPAFRIFGFGGLLLPPIAGAIIGAAIDHPSHGDVPSLPSIPAAVDSAVAPQPLTGLTHQLDQAIADYAKVYQGRAQSVGDSDLFQAAQAQASKLVSAARTAQAEGKSTEALADLAAAHGAAEPLYEMAEAAEPDNGMSRAAAFGIGAAWGAGVSLLAAPVSVPGTLWAGMALADVVGGLPGRLGAKTSRQLLTREQGAAARAWLYARGIRLSINESKERTVGWERRSSLPMEERVLVRRNPRGDGAEVGGSRGSRQSNLHFGIPVGNDLWLRHQSVYGDFDGRFYIEHREGHDVGNGRREVQVGQFTVNYPEQAGQPPPEVVDQ